MKFFTERFPHKPSTFFSVMVDDMEFHQKTSVLRGRFVVSLLNNLCLMVAGYYFKRHRDELEAFIHSDELKLMIAKELASRMEMKINASK